MSMGKAAHSGASFLGTTIGGGVAGLVIVGLFGGPCTDDPYASGWPQPCLGSMTSEDFLKGGAIFAVVASFFLVWAMEDGRDYSTE